MAVPPRPGSEAHSGFEPDPSTQVPPPLPDRSRASGMAAVAVIVVALIVILLVVLL